MEILLIKRILTVCCASVILTVVPACYSKRCEKCGKSEISMTKSAKPEKMTKRHHRKSLSYEAANNKDEDQ